ncbi:helix-turn-helix domain-containing protein [Baaleninema simplex]|uniref:helix-turn-helix domain-containing protein n=1 Tax=Baaleninema simplex TaxID=2862350 RepID=UPI0003493BFD|nr:transcriptional regulator [Baaleninema simplex]
MLDLKPIKTEVDYDRALLEIERLFDAPLGTPEGDQLEILTTLVEAYEAKIDPIERPEPSEQILYLLESRNLESSRFIAGLKCRGVSDDVIREALIESLEKD